MNFNFPLPRITFLLILVIISEVDLRQFVTYENIKTLYIEHYNEAAINYSRLRDFYRIPDKTPWEIITYPELLIAHILATTVNVTFPELISSVEYGIYSVNLNYSKNARNKYNRYVQTRSKRWSYAYCAIVSKEKYSIWDFTLFLEPFDLCTWLLFVSSFMLVVIFCKDYQYTRMGCVMLSTLSSALSLGTQALSSRPKLFLMWMWLCMVIGNFYTGEIQSKLIKPAEDDLIKNFGDLKKLNYSLVMPTSSSEEQFQVLSYLNHTRLSRSESILKELLQGVINIPVNLDLYKPLAFWEGKWATVGPWFTVLMYEWLLKNADNSTRKRKDKLKCHMGKEMLSVGKRFFIFYPSASMRLVPVLFQKLVESGIQQRLMKEGRALMHSSRVQERVRVKSPTKILPIEVAPIKALILEGRLFTIFLFWATCIIITLISHCVEHSILKCVSYRGAPFVKIIAA